MDRPPTCSLLLRYIHTYTQDPSLPPLVLAAARPLTEANPKLGLSVFTSSSFSSSAFSSPLAGDDDHSRPSTSSPQPSSGTGAAVEGATAVGGRGVSHQEVLAALKVVSWDTHGLLLSLSPRQLCIGQPKRRPLHHVEHSFTIQRNVTQRDKNAGDEALRARVGLEGAWGVAQAGTSLICGPE